MICYEFKGGTGTASRLVPVAGGATPVAATLSGCSCRLTADAVPN